VAREKKKKKKKASQGGRRISHRFLNNLQKMMPGGQEAWAMQMQMQGE